MTAQANTATPEIIDWSYSNTQTVNHVIIKPYRQLAKSAAILSQRVYALCTPTIPTSEKENIQRRLHTQAAFRHLFRRWANVQFISIGPMAYLQRTERFQYWPDKHAVGNRQLRRLLQEETLKHNHQTSLINLAQLQKKSVAVQGIPALERLLFTKKTSLSPTECHLANIISQNLHSIAQENIDAWVQPPTLFVNEMIHRDRGFGVYSSEQVVANVLFNMLSTQLLIVDLLKLQRALPQGKKTSRPTRLEAWKSQLSLPLIQENMHSLQQLYRHGFYSHLKKKDSHTAKKIMVEFHQINAILKNSTLSLAQYIQTNTTHPTIEKILTKLATLQTLINTRMASELKLSTKFNALDGD
jgi:predicted lipoprotein